MSVLKNKMDKKQIAVMIVESEETRRCLMEHLDKGKITYVNILPAELRGEIIKAIEKLDSNE